MASPSTGRGTPTKRARGGGGGGKDGGDAAARRGEGVSGPVGEWLKAEGEARMKMADHRRWGQPSTGHRYQRAPFATTQNGHLMVKNSV